VRVEAHAVIAQAPDLARTRAADLFPGGERARERRRAARAIGIEREMREHVDAIEQRAAQATAVACEVGLCTAAALADTGVAARAGVGGGDQHEARRVYGRVVRAHDRDATVLHGLAKRLERDARELRQLVEEEDAVVRE